jgi:hypothetical protein
MFCRQKIAFLTKFYFSDTCHAPILYNVQQMLSVTNLDNLHRVHPITSSYLVNHTLVVRYPSKISCGRGLNLVSQKKDFAPAALTCVRWPKRIENKKEKKAWSNDKILRLFGIHQFHQLHASLIGWVHATVQVDSAIHSKSAIFHGGFWF